MADGERLGITRRHEQTIDAMSHDFPATRHVGRDDRQTAGGGFEQTARHAFPVARQHGDVDFAQQLRHVGHMPEISDNAVFLPLRDTCAAISMPDCRDRGCPPAETRIGSFCVMQESRGFHVLP